MTLRDLTPRQLYNLRRRSEMLRKKWWARPEIAAKTTTIFSSHTGTWEAAFNAGLKTALNLIPGDGVYGPKYIHLDQIKK